MKGLEIPLRVDQRIDSTSYNAGPGVHAGKRDRNVKFWPGTKKCGYTDSAKQNLCKAGISEGARYEVQPSFITKRCTPKIF